MTVGIGWRGHQRLVRQVNPLQRHQARSGNEIQKPRFLMALLPSSFHLFFEKKGKERKGEGECSNRWWQRNPPSENTLCLSLSSFFLSRRRKKGRREETPTITALPSSTPERKDLIRRWWWMLYDCRLLFPFSFPLKEKKGKRRGTRRRCNTRWSHPVDPINCWSNQSGGS